MDRDHPTGQLEPATGTHRARTIRLSIYIIGSLVLFVLALDLMISSLQHLGGSVAETIITATANPFTALFIGLLITAMIQSSSTTTSMVVALVASGSISLHNAAPIVMGANIGTTITSTIVALGFINKKKEFRRAVAAGTYHDAFNILTVLILFPLEYYYGFLSTLSSHVARYFQPAFAAGARTIIPNWSLFGSLVDWFIESVPGFLAAVLSFVLLFTSILLFRRLISNLLLAESPERFSRFFFKNQGKSFLWGIVTTAAIRSSTITTSVVVPIVAKRIVSLRKAFPFILGANIGTTITAFLAAILNANTTSAISIAIVHILFNLLGVLLFFPIPLLRQFPLQLARRLGTLTMRFRLAGLLYVLTVFFLVPFSLIYLNKGSSMTLVGTYRLSESSGEQHSEVLVATLQHDGKSGRWKIYHDADRVPERMPDLIFTLNWTSSVLFVNRETFLFSKPGSCWDGKDASGTYQMCVKDIRAHFMTSSGRAFDSVYVFEKAFHGPTDSASTTRIYVSPDFPLFLRREQLLNDRIVEVQELATLDEE